MKQTTRKKHIDVKYRFLSASEIIRRESPLERLSEDELTDILAIILEQTNKLHLLEVLGDESLPRLHRAHISIQVEKMVHNIILSN